MIEIKNLEKSYGTYKAVDGLSLTMEKGKIYGLLGSNGAGKSTTMNIMTGFIGASSGTVTIDGFDILHDAAKAKKNIGYLPEIPPLYPEMTVEEYLKFVAELKGVSKSSRKDEIERVMTMADLHEVRYKLIRKLSKGYKQRVGFAQAVMGSPEVIILDEPTVGLDPIQITEFRETVRSLRDDHIVLISSHILAEISEVCDYVFILSKGKLVLSDSVDNLSKHFNKTQTLNVIAKGDIDKARTILSDNKDIAEFDVEEGAESGTIALTVKSADNVDLREWVSSNLASNGIIIFEMKEVQESLEDVFIELTLGDNEELEEESSFDATNSDEEDNDNASNM